MSSNEKRFLHEEANDDEYVVEIISVMRSSRSPSFVNKDNYEFPSSVYW